MQRPGIELNNKSDVLTTTPRSHVVTYRRPLSVCGLSSGRKIYFCSVCTVSSEEYCQWESFNASCSHNEVILITSAFYGRMRVGRCVPYDYYVGCSTDVFDHLASRCSARQRCVVPIPAPELFKVHPCRKDLVAYMDASYQCVPGLLDFQ